MNRSVLLPNRKVNLIVMGLLIVFASTAQTSVSTPNIILMIGDGMGLSQISALYVDTGYTNFNRMSITGLVRTTPARHKITDSAAGATAFSTGVKSYNNAIGVDHDTIPVPTIMETLKAIGYTCGIVVTSSVTHATPAAFYAHVAHRDQEEAIAMQLADSGLDFIAGGGTDFMEKRKDQLNMMDSLTVRGYTVHREPEYSDSSDGKRQAHLLAPKGMERYSKGRGDFLSLYTEKALKYLEARKQPFILLIEGSQIDWAGHANKVDYLLEELWDFNNAVGKAIDFVVNQPNTILVITADHETGGFSVLPSSKDYSKIKYEFASKEHSATLVPLFAHGFGAEQFSGIMENTAVYDRLLQLISTESAHTK